MTTTTRSRLILTSTPRVFCLLALGLCLATASYAQDLVQTDPVPGGIVTFNLPQDANNARFNGRQVLVTQRGNQHTAIVGLPLNTSPGAHYLTVHGTHGTQRIAFTVKPKTYATQRLTIKNKSLVTIPPKALPRIRRERKTIDSIYASFTPTLYATLPFSLPVKGIQTSPFGVHRVLNGKPRSPHSGIDIAAAAGTPVRAPGAGVVAAVGNFYFNGNTVIINHGEGLVSVYIHLSKIRVHKGEHVKRGQVIAEVGNTGRTTGADLHWTVTLNGTKINPKLLLSDAALKALK